MSEELRFVEETHQYFLAGRELPSVTTVLQLITDFSMVRPDVLEGARIRGLAVHKATELYDLGELDDSSVHPIVRPYLDAYVKFRSECGFSPEHIEQHVHNALQGFAGTLDRVGSLNGASAIVDLKARSSMTSEIGPQLAAYANAWKVATGEDLMDQRYSLQLRPDGSYRLHHYENDRDLSAFLACLNIYYWRQTL